MKLIWTGSKALDVVRRIISQSPQPEVQTEIARTCAEVIGLHLVMLIMVASDANLTGRHSCALYLFRGMEDALDCFAAVSLIPDAAEKWAEGNLKASNAAKLWEHKLGKVALPTGEKAIDYRKGLRSYFNNFAHCSPCLTDWNAYPEFDSLEELQSGGKITARVQINHEEKILEHNAIRIGAYLAAHTLEFISVVTLAYKRFLTQNPHLKRELSRSKRNLQNALKKFGAVYLESIPPELGQPILRHPSDPNLVTQLNILHEHDKDEANTANDG